MSTARCMTPARIMGLPVGGLLLLLATPATAAEPPQTLSFNRDVRPILADACFLCHGPDAQQRQADLRLDDKQNATKPRESGAALVPGRPDESQLYRRITAQDDSLIMPPPDQGRRLTADEVDIIRRWIEQGAQYETHWAFEPPSRPPVPAVNNHQWPRNAVDRFVLAALERQGLPPSPEADRATLIRRVTLDLTGLPPTPHELDAFLNDAAPNAYERLVDRLLASPHYGEHMAVPWLDAARYADSGGYQGDIPRTMWPWRDWVINAYNANMPFDQFTVEQLAGDLLPNATAEQIIATGFNRNHRVNDEDGIILEEFRVEYVIDRVSTTCTTWMGLTMGCARCHDHKYDPITQAEFYQLFAYFNNVAETGRGYGNTQPLFYFDDSIRPAIEDIDRRILALGDAAQGEYTKLLELKQQRDEILAQSLTTMVMHERDEPRETFVLEQGLYNRPGDPVQPGVPAVLSKLPDGAPPNRLGLARWLVDGRHPLTARVAVNRYWQHHFGNGLVTTPEDFGIRGSKPSHPELLDWLAVEFAGDWNIKDIHRLIVTSATYRQTSDVSPQTYRRDPDNRWLSRAPRLRLSAETIRDQALAAAGLLEARLGGPSVKPYQPEGLWKAMVSIFPDYEQSHGSDLYRRSVYTFIRRTVQPPAMNTLDFPSRESCSMRRAPTNTPLQALVVMNDPTYVEAARVLAARSLDLPAKAWIDQACRRVLARPPTEQEHQLLDSLCDFHRERFRSDRAAATSFLATGETPLPSGDSAELAARAAVAGLILNLDETLHRE